MDDLTNAILQAARNDGITTLDTLTMLRLYPDHGMGLHIRRDNGCDSVEPDPWGFLHLFSDTPDGFCYRSDGCLYTLSDLNGDPADHGCDGWVLTGIHEASGIRWSITCVDPMSGEVLTHRDEGWDSWECYSPSDGWVGETGFSTFWQASAFVCTEWPGGAVRRTGS